MAQPRKSTFAFDLSKPMKKGLLLKQGALHKAFKNRLFIIYPGFMVYYENETKWKLDLTKGETLGGRLGAVKLKKATVSIARNAPKGCKHGIMVTAPDPANKRSTYLMNAATKEERDQWIEAIRSAIPVSPQLRRKEEPKKEESRKPSEKPSEKQNGSVQSSGSGTVSPHPAHPTRQDTAVEAVLAVADVTDTQKEQEEVDQVITSVTNSLQEDPAPEFLSRHDTATLAAISLGHSGEHQNGLGGLKEAEEGAENREEEGNQETNIDTILGRQDGQPSSEDDQSQPSSVSDPVSPDVTTPEPVTPDVMSPGPEDAVVLAATERVEEGEGGGAAGEATVTTTVTVACSSGSASQNSAENSPALSRRGEGAEVGAGEGEGLEKTPTPNDVGNGEEESLQPNGEEGRRERSSSSTQVLLNDADGQVTLSVNLNNYDSDNTLSDEESHSDLPSLGSEGEKSPSPVVTVTTEGSRKEEEPKAEAAAEGKGQEEKGQEKKGQVEAEKEEAENQLVPPKNGRRRSSTPFVEKKGFLYKMGGQRKSWKLRYFVLRPGVFNYFKDSHSTKVIGEVKLKNLSIFFPGIGERKQSYQFTVHTESSWNKRADYVFAAQSEREMKEWITAFKLAGQKVGSPMTEPDDSD